MTAPKRLIVDADGFGQTAEGNAAIVAAHRRGLVTSASLQVDRKASAEVRDLAAASPDLGIGLQLDFGASLPASAAETLSAARAQLAKFRALLGRWPTHLAGPPDAPLSASVLEALVTLAWETGLPVAHGEGWIRERFAREGIATPDHVLVAGAGGPEDLLRLLGEVSPGTTEISCDPARLPALAALGTVEIRATTQALGISFIHFGQI